MKKLLIGLTLLLFMGFTGCTSMGDYNKELGVYIKTDEFDGTKTTYNNFHFERKELLGTRKVSIDIGLDKNNKPFITTEVLGYYFIEEIGFRSNNIDEIIQIKHDNRTLHGRNDIGLEASWTTSNLSKEDAIKILEIIKQKDCTVKVTYLNSYDILTHAGFGFADIYKDFAQNLINVIENK